MNQTRRTFLKNSAVIYSGMAVVQPFGIRGSSQPVVQESDIQDPRIKQLIERAVDAAISAGASYADARLSHRYNFGAGSNGMISGLHQDMSFGVRALYQGYWGFAASPVWAADEASRLGAAALRQAKMNVFGLPREIELAPMIEPSSGHWTMPVKDDPFRMSFDEIVDFATGLMWFIAGEFQHTSGPSARFRFSKIEKAFGSSINQYTTQMLYSTDGNVGFGVGLQGMGIESVNLDTLSPAGLGFEYVRDQNLREQCRIAYEEAIEILNLPFEPVDVGRYNVLIQPSGVAAVLSTSVGAATQIDRALGYEANAGGTSYIVDPSEMLRSFKIGSPLINITGDRSSPGSVGTVKWDDEGVTPARFDLVKDGILIDMQSNREGAGWLKNHYTKAGLPFRSYGCAFSSNSLEVPMIYNADLTLHPSSTSQATLDDMRANMKEGLELRNGRFTMDFQQSTGLGRGSHWFKIRNGKRVAKLVGAASIFRTSELWGNVIKIGGAPGLRRFGLVEEKGEPAQEGSHSVSAPPILVKDVTVVDLKKKA